MLMITISAEGQNFTRLQCQSLQIPPKACIPALGSGPDGPDKERVGSAGGGEVLKSSLLALRLTKSGAN